MKVILGLGNPGAEYAETRHNVGWWVLDHLAEVWRFEGWRKDGEALTSTGRIGTTTVRLVKPQTFMNLSGRVLTPWLRRPFWAAATDLVVISDEVQLPVGTFRFGAKGSAGGHNGLKSIEQALTSQDYPRLRIGVGPNDPSAASATSPTMCSDGSGRTRAPRSARSCRRWRRGFGSGRPRGYSPS